MCLISLLLECDSKPRPNSAKLKLDMQDFVKYFLLKEKFRNKILIEKNSKFCGHSIQLKTRVDGFDARNLTPRPKVIQDEFSLEKLFE